MGVESATTKVREVEVLIRITKSREMSTSYIMDLIGRESVLSAKPLMH